MEMNRRSFFKRSIFTLGTAIIVFGFPDVAWAEKKKFKTVLYKFLIKLINLTNRLSSFIFLTGSFSKKSSFFMLCGTRLEISICDAEVGLKIKITKFDIGVRL